MSPAKVVSVIIISEKEKKAEVLVTDDVLFLAIGKNGHNVRLAAKLTGWHIDVKSEGQKKQESNGRTEEQTEVFERLEGLSENIVETLVKVGIADVEKLSLLTVYDLTTLPGIGLKTAKEIIETAKK
jgi:N utilization substance protein A